MLAVVFHVNWNKFGTKVQTNIIMEEVPGTYNKKLFSPCECLLSEELKICTKDTRITIWQLHICLAENCLPNFVWQPIYHVFFSYYGKAKSLCRFLRQVAFGYLQTIPSFSWFEKLI